jgi:hypothetical protein
VRSLHERMFYFLAPRRRSGERTEERGCFESGRRTSSPRPSPPLRGGEGVVLVAALPLCVSASLRQKGAHKVFEWLLKVHRADSRAAASSTGVSAIGLAFMLLAWAAFPTISSVCFRVMP